MTDNQAAAGILRSISEDNPELSDFGFGVWDEHKLSPEERAKRLQEDRTKLVASAEAFGRARQWLSGRSKTTHVNPRAGSSYALKHRAEPAVGYLTNGVFIAAARAEGFQVRRIPASPNAWFNIATRARAERRGPARGGDGGADGDGDDGGDGDDISSVAREVAGEMRVSKYRLKHPHHPHHRHHPFLGLMMGLSPAMRPIHRRHARAYVAGPCHQQRAGLQIQNALARVWIAPRAGVHPAVPEVLQ